MRRIVMSVGLLITLLAGGSGSITAQGTPAAEGGLLAGLGYPELVITGSDSGFEVPAEVAAGTVLLTLQNNAAFPLGFSLVQLPEGASMADLGPPPGAEGATPVEGEEGGGDEGFPPILYDATWAGGVFAMPGGAAQSVVTLGPGEWNLLTPPDAALPPAMLKVTGEADEAVEADVDAVAVELDNFQVRLPDVIPMGPSVWDVTNIGDQPHEIFIAQSPERLSSDDAMTLLLLPEDATPPAGLPSLEEIEPVGFVAPISQDQSTMVEMDLAPGHYVAVCFLPEKEKGTPHALEGMVVTFSVGAEGEAVDPPSSPEPSEHNGH